MQEKIKNLRAATLEEIQSGAKVCNFGFNAEQEFTYVSGPNHKDEIVLQNDEFGFAIAFWRNGGEDLKLVPLGWIEDKPVYKGDVLYYKPFKSGESVLTITGLHESGRFSYVDSRGQKSCFGVSNENLTWAMFQCEGKPVFKGDKLFHTLSELQLEITGLNERGRASFNEEGGGQSSPNGGATLEFLTWKKPESVIGLLEDTPVRKGSILYYKNSGQKIEVTGDHPNYPGSGVEGKILDKGNSSLPVGETTWAPYDSWTWANPNTVPEKEEVPVVRQGWINVYPASQVYGTFVANSSNVYPTKEEAEIGARDGCIATVMVSW